jgi:hypothetical protein
VKNLTEKYLNYSARVGNNVKTLNRLELSSRDNQFFLTMVNGLATNPTSASHERIAAAFQAIGGWVDETVENEKTLDEKLTALSRMEDVINDDCTVIFIKTESQNDAYQLFQVLNDRGVNLTEGDLLRACTLQMLEGYEDLQKVAESAWDSILTDGPERTTQFLRWYFQSKTGHAASKSQLYDDLLEGLFPQNKHVAITPDDAQAIAEQVLNLKKEVVLCRKLYEAEWPYLELSEGVWARDRLNLLITQLEHTHCMPLLLAATRLSQQKFAAVVHLIERFFFRYKVICNAHISPLSRVYMQQATVIRTSPETYTLDNLVAQLNSLVPRATDELFKTALDSLIYRMDQSNKIIKYYLMTLEQYFAWYNNGASGSPTPEIVKVWDFPKTTIEHVYPQHATDVVAELEPHIHRFGNLTIMGPSENNDLGSVGFGEKRPKLAQSTVHMNREIAQASAWDLAAIVAREQKMKEVALKVFAPW